MFYMAGIARFGLANTYFDREKYKISQKNYERSIFHYQQGRLLPSWVNLSQVAIVRVKVMNEEKNISNIVETARVFFRKNLPAFSILILELIETYC